MLEAPWLSLIRHPRPTDFVGAATRLVGLSWLEDFQAIIVRRRSGPRCGADLCERRIGLPAGHAARVDALRAADMRVLVDISGHPKPWVKIHTALLHAVTVSETLLSEYPQVIAQELLDLWPLLPARMSLDKGALSALEALKTFMVRWDFIRADFTIGSWADC